MLELFAQLEITELQKEHAGTETDSTRTKKIMNVSLYCLWSLSMIIAHQWPRERKVATANNSAKKSGHWLCPRFEVSQGIIGGGEWSRPTSVRVDVDRFELRMPFLFAYLK